MFRLVLALSLPACVCASTINFQTNAPSGTCFVNTYNDPLSGCQASGLSTSFSNAQGDTASISWAGLTGSISFLTGPLQPVTYGKFVVSYTANGADTTPVTISPVSMALIIKEFSPSVVFYQPVLVDFSGTQAPSGQVGPSSADLEATFSPVSVANGTDPTFFLPSAATPLNLGNNSILGQAQSTSAVPEPSSWIFIVISLAILMIQRRGAFLTAAFKQKMSGSRISQA